jgi:hypothetical protein
MNNTKVLEEFFIWEENNSTEPKNNCLNNNESVHCDTTTKIKNDSIKKDWKDIIDPKLKEKMRQRDYYESNKDKLKIKKKKWYEDNKEKVKDYQKDYRIINKDVWRIKYYPKHKHKHNKYRRERAKTDIQYKLKLNLRYRFKNALNGNYKTGSAVKDLGCTIAELKQYLESKFQSGMTWDNYGLYGWHIDHIKPLASFDLTDRKQMLEACHYTNLQPLWAKDNLIKSDNY